MSWMRRIFVSHSIIGQKNIYGKIKHLNIYDKIKQLERLHQHSFAYKKDMTTKTYIDMYMQPFSTFYQIGQYNV